MNGRLVEFKIMKQLQNNFTTPEQSKRLLELGVPADSADCYFDEYSRVFLLGGNYTRISTLQNLYHRDVVSCWSVGRLIEIFEKCTGERFSREIDESTLQLKPLIEDVIAQIEKHLKMIYRRLDLSKLEE